MKQKFLLVPALLFVSIIADAQTRQINTAKLDSFLTAVETHDRSMCAIAVAKNGQMLYERAIGYESLSPRVHATPQTEYRIGSITKTFTAAMIFQLIQEKKLTLKTKLARFFRQIPNAKKITIGQMLSHHSGIYNFTNLEGHDWTQPHSEKQIVNIIANTTPAFSPGDSSEYSNSNFVLLGYILEHVTKKPYAQNLEERIVKPLGLTHTYYGGKVGTHPHEALPFVYNDSTWEQYAETDMSVPGGAGAIVSTAGDLVRFLDALIKDKVVSHTSLETMHDIHEGYGMGLVRFPFGMRWLYGHNGHIDTYESCIGYLPDSTIYCVIGNAWQTHENDILVGVLSIANNMKFKIPEFKNIRLTPEDLAQYIGIYSSPTVPLKFSVKSEGKLLTAQATGQGAFPLDVIDTDRFQFTAGDITIQFIRNDQHAVKGFDITQMGHTENFMKE